MQTGDKKVFKSSDIVYQSIKFTDDTSTIDGVGTITNSTVHDTLWLIQQYLDTIKPDLVPGQQLDDVLLSEIRLRSVFHSSIPSPLSALSLSLTPLLINSSDYNQEERIVEASVPQSLSETAFGDPSTLSTMTIPVQESLLTSDEFLLSAIHVRSEDFNSQGTYYMRIIHSYSIELFNDNVL